MSDKQDVNIQIEHLLAAAIVANDGSIELDIEDILSDQIVGKQFKLTVDDGRATITLVDGEEV